MDALLSHPTVLLALAWLFSRLQIVGEVRTRIGPEFKLATYLIRRWPQIGNSALVTLLAYGVGVGLGAPAWLVSAVPLDPALTPEQALAGLAFGAGVGADQIIERATGVIAKRRRSDVAPGQDDGDITRIVNDLRRDETKIERDKA